MRTTTSVLILAGLAVLSAAPQANAQQTTPSQVGQLPPPVPIQPPPAPAKPGPPPAPEATRAAKRWEPYVAFASAFDTNIDHNKEDVDSVGAALGIGVNYRNDPRDPVFELNAEVAGHSYTNTSRWDRFSQKLNASYEIDLPGRWGFDTTGEISLKGSSEDREISNQYVVIPRLAYRITSQTRVRVYAAARARRYEEDPGRNAFNRYVGVEFTERAAPNRRWDVDLRYEVNATEASRQHYVRWTFGTGYEFVLPGSNRLEIEAKYRMQRYPYRLVDVDDTPTQRRDHRWIPRVAWTHPVGSRLDLRALYTRESKWSNDPDREFTANLFSLGFVRRW